MQISEVSTQCGLSIDTIRFYERSGLLPPVDRTPNGQRSFSSENIDWLILLASLRDTGMPMTTMKHFAELYVQGDQTIPERRNILHEHAKLIEARRAELDECSQLLAHKLQRYREIEAK